MVNGTDGAKKFHQVERIDHVLKKITLSRFRLRLGRSNGGPLYFCTNHPHEAYDTPMETPLAIGAHSIYLCGVSGGYNGVTTPFLGWVARTVAGLSTQ